MSDKVHQILGDRWYMSCWADFKTDEALALFKKNEMNKALDHANEARPLLLGILENKKADAQIKHNARDILDKMQKAIDRD